MCPRQLTLHAQKASGWAAVFGSLSTPAAPSPSPSACKVHPGGPTLWRFEMQERRAERLSGKGQHLILLLQGPGARHALGVGGDVFFLTRGLGLLGDPDG